jgi:hypothetical protein
MFKIEDKNMAKLVPLVISEQIGIVILSYSFTGNFEPLVELAKILIVDYAIFMPIVIFVAVNVGIKFYKLHKNPEQKQTLTNLDFILIAVFAVFLATAMGMAGWTIGNYNLIKAFVVSIIFFGISLELRLRFSTAITIIATHVFLGLMLNLVGGISSDWVLITLMAISSVLILFAVINEIFLIGEPITSAMIISGSLILMATSFVYFEFLALWVSLIWAFAGLYLFVFGLLFNKISLRRSGLIIILADVVYSIVYVARLENRTLLGIGFMILAIVLFACILLFRWSEQRLKKEVPPEPEDLVEAAK